MTAEEFEEFLKRLNYSKQTIRNMLADTSVNVFLIKAKATGRVLSLGEAEKLAKVLRKKFAGSISLIESKTATPKELIDDLS